MSPETTAGRPAALQHAIFNTEVAASSHSAPEPSSRVASPTHAHSSHLRPSSASAAVPSHPVSKFEQSLGQSAYQGLPQLHTRTGSAGASISEVQDWGHESDVSQAYGGDLADSMTAAPGQASIIEAVAAAQQQANAGTRQGDVKCAPIQLFTQNVLCGWAACFLLPCLSLKRQACNYPEKGVAFCRYCPLRRVLLSADRVP